MKIYMYRNWMYPAEQLDDMNKWLEKNGEPIHENPTIQEVPDDASYKDFKDGLFSEVLYNNRKEELAYKDYKARIKALIRLKYDEDDEFSILRQRDSKPDEFVLYNTYVENCKAQVKNELNK